MKECHISIQDVYLDYPSAVYNRKSLKQEFFERLRLQKPAKLLSDVHALRGVSFEISEGERVGIVGPNGAGKSTTLKAIAGLFPITSGRIETHGKIRSLLDLGTGFEIEATGRENIMYRVLLLGETPESVREKTEEIIEFAELGEFIDYPIKTYSSGMIVRLAFSISTMIQGDILLLDEIFGAGDARFMKKATDRIKNIIEQAHILVFVSHDFHTVKDICTRAIWLENGKIVMDGPSEYVVDQCWRAQNGLPWQEG